MGIATYELLQKLGCEVSFPMRQTCCGQPMANSGYEHLTQSCDANFVANFAEFDYIVCPSGSCVLHVKEHLHDENNEELSEKIRKSVFELTEFITDILKVENIEGNFPHKVGLHQSCHGQRGLKLSQMSELNAPFFSKPEQLLSNINGINLVSLNRKEMHIVIVDNGRTTQLGRADFRNSLKGIRCGACMNTCPVYRRSGGHSYHTAVAGPIGSILAPNLDMSKNADLPFASTLCGSCTNICPVKIDIYDQLYKWRQVLVKEGYSPKVKTIAMKGMATVLANPVVFDFAGKVGRFVIKNVPFMVNNGLNAWYKQREMPAPPEESFREWYKKNGKEFKEKDNE